MPTLLDVDHPCAQRQIADARNVIEFNTGSTAPFIIKSASSNSELAIKAEARVQDPKAYAVPSADCTEPRVLTPPEDSRQQPLKLPVTGSTAFLMQFDTCGSDMVDVSHGIATFV
ncbi:hypothetical protein MRB53_033616 [Persea americana]|uniref:Uncharacterized protein n=1 Tax=Persea americana TaxID=3435 RepID=A0ACC2KW37_PERAE|nr:hypothetical protein MRB53_033616 [Persea americana]